MFATVYIAFCELNDHTEGLNSIYFVTILFSISTTGIWSFLFTVSSSTRTVVNGGYIYVVIKSSDPLTVLTQHQSRSLWERITCNSLQSVEACKQNHEQPKMTQVNPTSLYSDKMFFSFFSRLPFYSICLSLSFTHNFCLSSFPFQNALLNC